ncbi:MAG: 50S ribosomal protein L23, partial [Deltaproteobacteria bacterium]
MNPAEVVQGPVITEKGTLVNELGNQVVFRVHPRANKVEIRHAVETLFKVKVEKV